MHAPVRVERLTLFQRLIREPLVHFLLIGLLLFVLYAVVGGGGSREIRIDDNVTASLYAQFHNTWQRPPTPNEMNALVDSYIREQIFYREGVALGLDRGDPTITRRISQKFTTIAEESGAAGPASDAELERWLAAHADRYADPPLVTFDQIAFEQSANENEKRALDAAREALAEGADPQSLGSDHMLLPHYELYPADLVQRDFGPGFAKALLSVRRGVWEGPLTSGYGAHLVRVEKVLPGRVPKLDEVRTAVARDYEEERRRKSVDETYRKLLRSYRIDYSGAWKPAVVK
jgi:hypothetical protein